MNARNLVIVAGLAVAAGAGLARLAAAQAAPGTAPREAMVDREVAPPAAPGSIAAPGSGGAAGEKSGEPSEMEANRADIKPDQPAGSLSVRRDPFWPVGYVPRVVEKPPPGAAASSGAMIAPAAPVAERPLDWNEAKRHVDIRGTSRVGRDKSTGSELYQAVVNGRIVEAGDTVSVSFEGRLYRWRVQAITPAGVSLTRMDARAE